MDDPALFAGTMLHHFGGSCSLDDFERGFSAFPMRLKRLEMQGTSLESLAADSEGLLGFDERSRTLTLQESLPEEVLEMALPYFRQFQAKFKSVMPVSAKQKQLLRMKPLGIEDLIDRFQTAMPGEGAVEVLREALSICGVAFRPLAAQVLQIAARKASATVYIDVLRMLVETLDLRLSVTAFCGIAQSLVARLPVEDEILRLTLNLVVPVGGDIVPISTPGDRGVARAGSELAQLCRRLPERLLHGRVRFPRPHGFQARPRIEDVASDYVDRARPGEWRCPNPLCKNHTQGTVASNKSHCTICGERRGGMLFAKGGWGMGLMDEDVETEVEDEVARDYFGHFAVLLHLEALEELIGVDARLRLPEKDQDAMGFKLSGLKLVAGGGSGSRDIMEVQTFEAADGGALPESKLRAGDTVLLSRGSPLEGSFFVGTLKNVRHNSLEWTLDDGVDEPDLQVLKSGVWRIDRVAHLDLYRRQLEALRLIAVPGDKNRRFATNGGVKDVTGVDIAAPRIAFWNVLTSAGGFGGSPSAGSRPAPAPRAPLAGQRVAMAPLVLPFNAKGRMRSELAGSMLNPSQQKAVAAAAMGKLTLIQGPPGTGKTKVAAEIIRQWIQVIGLKRVLAVSHNNIAVDNMMQKAHAMGLTVVRIGEPERISDELRPFCFSGKGNLEEAMQAVREADVVFATNLKTGSAFFKDLRFSALLMDEAAQATELSALVPLASSLATQVVMLGDHQQLPPHCAAKEAVERGLELSMFERLTRCGFVPHFLDVQYRMHPFIAEFPSQRFYDGRLESAVPEWECRPPKGFAWPNADLGGVAFVHVEGAEEAVGTSAANAAEVAVVARLLDGFLEAGELAPGDVGVISPYAAQVRELQRVLPARLEQHLGNRRGQESVQVSSVDGFQGHEKELIVVSAVRSNDHGIGFLRDERRLNVMLTRAKRGLIVVGNRRTLGRDPTWAAFLSWLDENGLVVEGEP